ncbi:DUF2577 family protein [Tissierella pigra]|uniref:DUF2577 domain-containing protein n=1 Tax=Tissierella pigra TaxID=2607614 RepID=A0A6N7XMC8_9FIRM|nr:DUF2577 family protein [Tissierella pigra]MSU03209.1 DUF2577 domain-containing protein [Tissierella pigra]
MWDVGLAQMFKERENKINIGPCVGKIVGVKPLKVSILDGQVILQEGHLYICQSLAKREYKLELNADGDIGDIAITSKPSNPLISFNISEKEKTKLTLYFELKQGDEVLIIPAENQQVFFIVDKIQKSS